VTVRTRGDGIFFIDITWPDGVRTRKDMPDQQTAERINKKIEVAIVDEDRIWKRLRGELRLEKSSVCSFSELADLYYGRYVQSYLRDRETNKSRLKALKQFFKSQPVGSLNPRSVAAFVAFKRQNKIKNATINRYLGVLSGMMTWAVEQEILEASPLGRVSKLKEPEWVGERPEDAKVDEIFSRLDARALPIFVFLRETGCRRGEAIELRHDQIDYANRTVSIHGNTKSGKARLVPLTDQGIWAVQAMPKYGPTVFYHPTYLKPFDGDGLGWIWDRARGDSPLRIHDLRHAFAIKLAEEGCPMHYISAVLGHHSTAFTEKRYARFSPENASRAVLRVLQGCKAAQGSSGAMTGN
jgi:integrase